MEGHTGSLPGACRERRPLPLGPLLDSERDKEKSRSVGEETHQEARPWPSLLPPAFLPWLLSAEGKRMLGWVTGVLGLQGNIRGWGGMDGPWFLTIASVPVTSSHLRGREEAWLGRRTLT